MAKAITHQGAASYELPASFSREIGRIAVRCSYIEHRLQQAIFRLLQISPAMGRIATRTPRAENRLDMIRDLAIVRQIEIDEEMMSTIKTTMKDLWDSRDLIVHGVWLEDDDRWILIKTTGNWPKQWKTPVNSRRIMAEAVPIDLTGLRKVVRELERVISDIRRWLKPIDDALPKPPEEPLEQFVRKDRAQDRTKAKPSRQPKPPPA